MTTKQQVSSVSPEAVAGLRDLLVPYFQTWSRDDAHRLSSAAGVADFFTFLAGCDEFWRDLAAWGERYPSGLDLAHPRAGMTASAPSDFCRALGLAPEEEALILDGMRHLAPRGESVHAAFAAETPSQIAEQLEMLAGRENPGAVSRRLYETLIARAPLLTALGLMVGVAILAALAGCRPGPIDAPMYKGVAP